MAAQGRKMDAQDRKMDQILTLLQANGMRQQAEAPPPPRAVERVPQPQRAPVARPQSSMVGIMIPEILDINRLWTVYDTGLSNFKPIKDWTTQEVNLTGIVSETLTDKEYAKYKANRRKKVCNIKKMGAAIAREHGSSEEKLARFKERYRDIYFKNGSEIPV